MTQEQREKESGFRFAAIALRVVLIAFVVFVPWFHVNYYVGSAGFNLFTASNVLSSGSSIARTLASWSGSISLLPDWLQTASTVLFCMGIIPVAFLIADLYLCVRKTRHAWYGCGPYAVMVTLIVGLFFATVAGTSIRDAITSTLGESVGTDVITMDIGWWLTLVLAGAAVLLDLQAQRRVRLERDHGDTQIPQLHVPPLVDVERELEAAREEEKKALETLGRAALPVLERHGLAEECAKEFHAAKTAIQACEVLTARIEAEHAATEGVSDQHVEEAGVRICPKCHSLILPDDSFCAGCGAKVSELVFNGEDEGSCPVCKKSVKAGARFCAGCGAKFV